MSLNSKKPKKRLFRISRLTTGLSALVLVSFGLGLIVFINLQMRQHALESARQKARIILDRNFATHTYFNQRLKPAVFRLTDPITTTDHFDPVWMSSTYAVREIEKYFRAMISKADHFPSDYYYKECAINARSPENEADAHEKAFLEKLNTADSTIKTKNSVRTIGGKPFYTVLRRAEVMEETCLRCHGAPRNAPEEMVAIYGNKRSFHRKPGDVVSAVSIRIPLSSAYASANKISVILTVLLAANFLVIYGVHYLINRHYIFRPIWTIQQQASEIADNEEALGKTIALPAGKELRQLTAAFNSMSQRLRYHIDHIESLVQERTRQLTAEKELIATTLRSIGDAVITADTSGKITMMNPTAEALTGWKAADGIDQPIGNIFHIVNEYTRETVSSPVERVISTGKTAGLANHTLLISRDGGEVPILDSGAPIVMADGQIAGVVLVFQDDTKRRESQKVIEESEKKYRALIEYSLDHIFMLNFEGTYIASNDRLAAFELPAGGSLVGRSLKDVYEPELAHFYRDKLDEVVAGEAAIDFEHEIKTAAESLYHHDTLYPIYLDGKLWAIGGICRDISEQRRLEKERFKLQQELHQSQKMESIGTLAGGIAHDFNNLLSSIIGYTELALDEANPNPRLRGNLQEIYAAGKRARDLVWQILAYARQSEESVKPIQVGTIVEDVIRLIRSSIPTTIDIKKEIQTDSLVMGHPNQIYQIIMNLCTNAAHAMDKNGGVLQVDLKDIRTDSRSNAFTRGMKSGDYIEIAVSDTGHGIPPEIVDSIFEPYFTTKGPGEGTGMGLAVVQGIVEKLGGRIIVENRKQQGTVFRVFLPITMKRTVHRPDENQKLPTGTERILVVDDEASIAQMSRQVLIRLGYTVTMRTSSLEALALFRSTPSDFDLVVTDMTMPDMTGDLLAADLISIRPDIPIILCTGYSNKISEKSAAEMGIKAFAHKPMVMADMARTVRKVLDEAQSRRR